MPTKYKLLEHKKTFSVQTPKCLHVNNNYKPVNWLLNTLSWWLYILKGKDVEIGRCKGRLFQYSAENTGKACLPLTDE